MTDETFDGSGFSIERPDGQFLLVPDSTDHHLFDSFEELVEFYPICESARGFFFGTATENLGGGWYEAADGTTIFSPDAAHDTTGNGSESAYELTRQLEMRGYRVDPNEEDNEHSYVRFGESDDIIADIRGDETATVTNR